MNIEHLQTVLDALEFKASKFSAMLEREPKRRGGKLNIMRPHLQKQLDDIAAAVAALTLQSWGHL